MNIRIVVLTICLAVAVSRPVSAQEPTEFVAFRLKEWTSLHVDSEDEARKQVQTLKKLGCETRVEQHGGHTDVSFRVVRWTDVSFASHESAERWEKWLTEKGFQTLHGHTAEPERGEIAVRVELSQWQSQHFDDAAQAEEFAAMCRGLGCEVRSGAHDGHSDVRYRCVTTRTVICEDHEQAHALQAWLDKKGFQTTHAH